MSVIRGTIRGGDVILDRPADLPDGTRVTLKPNTSSSAGDDLPADEDDSAAAIEKRLALMDCFQPWMTAEELAAWEETRAADKAFQLAQWEKWAKPPEEPAA